jgi:gliding motility-associated protein GldC
MNDSEIKIKVALDVNHVPEKMSWSATDAGVENQDCKALLLSVWDSKEKNALRIDLWTKDMSIDDMKIFFHQSLMTMADTFEKATGEKNICEDLRDYCYHFAEKMKII